MTPTVTIFTSISTSRKWKADRSNARSISDPMRYIIALLILTTPAFAWEFSPVPICTVSTETPQGAIELTYDPSQAEPYAIAVTHSEAWNNSPVFGLQFSGTNGLTITTDRQSISGNTLIVRDTGFGNVLNGLQFNTTVTAFQGEATVVFSLDGAAPEIARFRDCLATPIA